MYVPAARDEMLRFFKAIVLAELQRFRWKLFDEAVRDADYAGALYIAGQALDEQAAGYELEMFRDERRSVHVAAPDRVSMYLASIFGRLNVIDRVISFERLALDEAKRPYREVHEARLAQALEHKADHARFGAILEAVRQRPGILQMDLTEVVPDRDTKAVTWMVDQLEATGLVAPGRSGTVSVSGPRTIRRDLLIPSGANHDGTGQWMTTGRSVRSSGWIRPVLSQASRHWGAPWRRRHGNRVPMRAFDQHRWISFKAVDGISFALRSPEESPSTPTRSS